MKALGGNIRLNTRWLLATCLTLFCLVANAQNNENNENKRSFLDKNRNTAYSIDINIFNRYDDHLIDTSYMGNFEVLHMLDSIMQDTTIINHTQKINVVSSSSIEGRESYNRALSQRRMNMIEAIFRSRYNYIPEDMWDFSCVPENWSHFRRAVESDMNIPSRDKVLAIVDMHHRHPDTREYLLKILDDGVPWSYIDKHILPSGRGSVSMVFVPNNLAAILPVMERREPIIDLVIPTPLPYSRPIMSIRSNLILDMTSTVNLAVEVPLSPHWSISAEYINPWWKNWDNEMTWQIQSLYFDLRYWLGGRGVHNDLRGWSIGAYAGSGCYDLQPFTDKGVQGEYSDFGLTLSYAHSLTERSKNWLVEYTIGLGYLTTHYRHYYTAADTDEYGNIKVHNYPWSEETLYAPMPTRLGVTLVYLINVEGTKRGGVWR